MDGVMGATRSRSCDVLVIGSGAGGLATAVTAAALGLEVIVAEKEPVFGGTTAWSGVSPISILPPGNSSLFAMCASAARRVIKISLFSLRIIPTAICSFFIVLNL